MKYGFRAMVRSDERAQRWSMDKTNNIIEGVSLVVGVCFFYGILLVTALTALTK